MKIAVDSNVLFDLLSADTAYSRDAGDAIFDALSSGVVVICPIVYAELASAFIGDTPALDRFARQCGILVDAFNSETLQLAAAAWVAYLRNRGQQAQCPHCGEQFIVTCPSCRQGIAWRQRVMPDFLIGAHALAQADLLLTRDPRRYATYFPQLTLRAPADR